MARSVISAKTKAAAIADLMDGEQPAVVAEKYGIPAGTVRQWKNRFVTPDVTDSVTSGVTPGRTVYIRSPQRDAAELEISQQILQNLRAKLLATQRIAEYAANTPAWLEKQTAADVGQLFEHIDRSALAILDRMAAAGSGAAASGSQDPPGADEPRSDLVD